MAFSISRLTASDRPALSQFWLTHWGDDFMVVNGRVFSIDQLDGFVALDESGWVGLVTFFIEMAVCEVVSLDSLQMRQGIGSALLKAVEHEARQVGCTLLKLTTTNDNTRALRFYQELGFELFALRCGAVAESRRIKPSIPEIGADGIPIRDEIDLHLRLCLP